MTNTNDFRRFNYQSESDYLINSFDFSRGSQATKLRPLEEPEGTSLKLHNNKRIKSRSQLKKEQNASFLKAAKVIGVAVLCLAMIGMVLHSQAQKNELTKEISAKQTAIANAQSEYISLESELNALVSMSSIDKYAVEKLGMTKRTSGQIQYMNVDRFRAAQKKVAAKEKAAQEKKSHQNKDKDKVQEKHN